MPLMPKRVKYRKVQRGSRKGLANSGNKVSYGEFGLQALERGWISGVQIEACRVAANRQMKRKGKLYIRIFPSKPITKKPLEVRMGKGKGGVDQWVAVVKPGTMLFEIEGVSESLAKECLRLAATKLPVKARFVHRNTGE
jgi:large subunit ribosomal protein L16